MNSVSSPADQPDLAENKIAVPSSLPALALVIGLLLVATVVHGWLSGRWYVAKDLYQAGAKLDELPKQIGAWQQIESDSLDDSVAKMLQCYGSIVREYRHGDTGEQVTVALLLGPRGPIAVHTPDICFSSVGTKQVGERTSKSVDRHRFWVSEFAQSPSPTATFEVWYGWSDGGEWVAAENPRFWMTPTLYKVQLVGSVESESSQPCRNFLKELLPQFELVAQ